MTNEICRCYLQNDVNMQFGSQTITILRRDSSENKFNEKYITPKHG